MVAMETPLPEGAVRGDGGNILNQPNLHPWAGKGSERWLGSWFRSLGPISSCGPEFDVEGSDAQLLASLGYILGSQHGSIWRGLISVSLHLTRQMVSLPERSVTWTKVSNDAKVWHTPNTFSSSATRGPRLMACSSFSFPLQGAISAHLQTHHWKELSLEVLRDLKKFYLKPLIS